MAKQSTEDPSSWGLRRWAEAGAQRLVSDNQRPTPVVIETPVKEPDARVREAFCKGWSVIVWNDPVNLMSYVVFVFMKVLGFTKEQATKHMLDVHHRGKSCVAIETREKAELYHQQIQAHGLIVTIQPVDSENAQD